MTPPDKKRSRRLRKKLHVGEFKELGFEFVVELADGLSTDDEESLVDCLLTEVVEPRSLAFAGWATGGYITRLGCGSTTEDDRKAIETWLLTRSEVKSAEVGPLRDAWYEGSGSSTAIRYCNGIGSCGHITPAGQNIFLDLGFEPSEAARLLAEADEKIIEKLKRNENIALVQREAEYVFGSKSKAREWLARKNLALGSTPLESLETDEGVAEVRKILSAIAHGGVV